MEVIEINDKNREAVLEIFDLAIDKKGYVVDTEEKELFAGIVKNQLRKTDWQLLLALKLK